MDIVLKRIYLSSKLTLGVLIGKRGPLCLTLEEPWLDNKPKISCIPPGTYKCVKHNGVKYKYVWRLENVPGRSAILIHSGNTTDDTEGCILVGERFSPNGILDSKVALERLRGILPDEFNLTIGEYV